MSDTFYKPIFEQMLHGGYSKARLYLGGDDHFMYYIKRGKAGHELPADKVELNGAQVDVSECKQMLEQYYDRGETVVHSKQSVFEGSVFEAVFTNEAAFWAMINGRHYIGNANVTFGTMTSTGKFVPGTRPGCIQDGTQDDGTRAIEWLIRDSYAEKSMRDALPELMQRKDAALLVHVGHSTGRWE